MAIVGAVTVLFFIFVVLCVLFVTGPREDVTEIEPPQSMTPSSFTVDGLSSASSTERITTDSPFDEGSMSYAGLTCITSERASDDTIDYTLLYQPCDNVIYSVGTRCSITSNDKGLQVVAGLADKGKFLGFSYDGSADVSCYANLGSVQGWENNGYAALGVVLANDFSDVAQVTAKLKSTFDTIEATGRTHRPKIAGIKINPADADITKDNTGKLGHLLVVNNISLVIFESHIGINGVPCKIAVIDVLIKKIPDSSVKGRTKYGVAMFDLHHYHLNQYPECPPLDLSAFKLPRPASTG